LTNIFVAASFCSSFLNEKIAIAQPFNFWVNPFKTSPSLIANLVTAISQGVVAVSLAE
jgi:hypothetical protein